MTPNSHITDYPQRELDREHYLAWLSRCHAKLAEEPTPKPRPVSKKLQELAWLD